MNAQVGLCRPGDYGSDVSHLVSITHFLVQDSNGTDILSDIFSLLLHFL